MYMALCQYVESNNAYYYYERRIFIKPGGYCCYYCRLSYNTIILAYLISTVRNNKACVAGVIII